MNCLKEKGKVNEFSVELKYKFSSLSQLQDENIEDQWHHIQELWKSTCSTVLGKKAKKHKEWLTTETWVLIAEKKWVKNQINQIQDPEEKKELQAQYWTLNTFVKRSTRKDKRRYTEVLTKEAETAAAQRNMNKLYDITRTLSGKNSDPSCPVKDKNGNLLSSKGDQRARWAEHFKETLNRPAPQTPPAIPPPTKLLGINTNPPSRIEISRAIKSLKTGKAAGPDKIPPETLKADTQTSTEMLCPLLNKVWEQEQVPEDWKKGHMVKLPKKGDMSSCNNWRGIMLLSIPGKVLTRIILKQLKTALDKKLRDEQAGCCQDRSCTDHIAIMRIIIEQSLEWAEPPIFGIRRLPEGL